MTSQKLIINMTPKEFKAEGRKYEKIRKKMMSKTNPNEYYTKKEFVKMFEESGYGSPCCMSKREIHDYLNIPQVRMKDAGKVVEPIVEPIESPVKMNIKPPKIKKPSKPKIIKPLKIPSPKLIYSGDKPQPRDPKERWYSQRDANGKLHKCFFLLKNEKDVVKNT